MAKAREIFLAQFELEVGKPASDFEGNPSGFGEALDGGSKGLRVNFYTFLDDSRAVDREIDAAAGLNALFGN